MEPVWISAVNPCLTQGSGYEGSVHRKMGSPIAKANGRHSHQTGPIERKAIEDATCEVWYNPNTYKEHDEHRDTPTTALDQCNVCNRTCHWLCTKELECIPDEQRAMIDLDDE